MTPYSLSHLTVHLKISWQVPAEPQDTWIPLPLPPGSDLETGLMALFFQFLNLEREGKNTKDKEWRAVCTG